MSTTLQFAYDIQQIKVAVDIVAITSRDGKVFVLLVKRKYPPFAGSWALPGGFVEQDEDLLAAAQRELAEETSTQANGEWRQIGAFGRPDRDPRQRVISIAFLCKLDSQTEVRGASDAEHAEWMEWNTDLELAFDHREIVERALQLE